MNAPIKHAVKLRDIEGSDSHSVFVVNNTKGNTRGQVIFGVPKATGVGLDTVIVPATFIPMELTAQVSKNQLMASSEFRNALTKGMLVAVDDKWAIQYLESADAVDEINRLSNQQEYQRNVMTATKTDDINIDNNAGLEKLAAATGDDNMIDTFGKIDGVSASVMQIVEMLKESKDQKGTIASLRAAGELEKEDYRYIMGNSPKEFTDVINWARKQYNGG